MQTNEKKQFQLSPQVLFMAAVVLLALVVPMAMGIYALGLVLGEKMVPAPEAPEREIAIETIGLRQKLEDVANERFGSIGWDSGPLRITLRVSDPEREQKRVEGLARKLGGTTLVSESENGGRTILVVLDREKAEIFLREGLGRKSAGAEPGLPADQSRVWVELVILKAESS